MSDSESRLITVAIHTFEKAVALRSLLESEGIEVTFNNVNLEHPSVSSGIRVRIHETDLPLALRIIENHEIFIDPRQSAETSNSHYILVPVDFSENSLKAVKIAASIAQIHKLSLVILNSFIDPYVGGEGVQLTDSLTYEVLDVDARQQIEKAAKEEMNKFAVRLRNEMKSGTIPAVKFTTEIVEGVPEDAIIVYTKTNPPLLTIMVTRDADKKEKEMVGSVSAEVLDGCRYPVMTIPENLTSENLSVPEKILFFCNADQEDILAMDTLCRLFPDTNAEITLAVVPTRRRWIERGRTPSANALVNYFKENYPDYKFESISVGNENAVDEIISRNKIHDFDLIVVLNKKKKNILGRIFNPSLAHKLVFSSDIPMLMIPV